MKLHFGPTSPFVRMVRVTAHEAGLADKITLIETGPLPPDQVHERLTADNPLGKIPCLVTDHGHALYDSRVICEYLAHHAGREDLLPDEPVKRFRVLTLQALGQGIAEAGVSCRYETAIRPSELMWRGWADRQKARILAALDEAPRSFGGELNDVTLGTIALACALGYLDFRFGEWSWRDGRPELTAFFASFSQRPSMQATQHANPA
jgi:glutathione S-transferase